jgi:hypothetical protein
MTRRVTPTRLRIGAGCLALAALLSGCAASAAVAPKVGTPAPIASSSSASADPQMVMITLSDLGYHASNIATGVQRPIMLMVVNRGTRAHGLRTSIPLTGLQTDDPAAPTATASGAGGPGAGFDLTVQAGQELDVSFTPTASGRYGLWDGVATVSALVVG